MQDYGARLVDNGYSIVPIMPGTKKPGRYIAGKGWVDFAGWRKLALSPRSAHDIEAWESWPECGIGIVCGNVCPIDIDVLDNEVALQVADIIQQHLGETSVVRIGRAPRMLLLYRTDTPFKKIQMHPIECLADGQQFVAYAMHPDTGRPYNWPMDGLADTPIERLPVVIETQVQLAMQAAFASIPEEMRPKRALTVSSHDSDQHVAGDLEGTPEAVDSILEMLPNDGCKDYDFWNRVGMATFKASRGRCYAAFDSWSQKNNGYNPGDTIKQWRGYKLDRITSIGFGTLQFLLEMSGAGSIDASIPFNEAKRAAADLNISGLRPTAPPPLERKVEALPEDWAAPSDDLIKLFPIEWVETESLVGQIVRWMNGTATFPQPALAVGNTLAALGALFGRRYVTSSEYLAPSRCNLYAVGIAPTASGKDHSRRCIEEIFQKCGLDGKFMGGENFSSETAIVNMLHLHPSRLCQVDELGEIMKSALHKNAMGAKSSIVLGLLKCFTASTYRGQEFADPRTRPRVDIRRPNLNIYATTTPQNLMGCLTRAEIENGLLNRMLFFTAEGRRPAVELRKIDRELPGAILTRVQGIMGIRPEGAGNLLEVGQMAEFEPKMMPVFFDDGVELLVVDLTNLQSRIVDEGRYIWGRYTEHTLKLAMIEAIAFCPEQPVITKNIFQMAQRLAFWCLDRAELLFNDNVAENTVERDKKMILRVIKASGVDGASLTLITRKTQGLVGDVRQKLLLDLKVAGLIREAEQPSSGGRKPMQYFYVESA